ncbi:MAG: hypothetical protein ACT6U0_23445 [Shinella sp.]|uniref:hypothetical protein n=1 Tax=Shinella sp. TaxID=1870904 RepID=UPI004036BF75
MPATIMKMGTVQDAKDARIASALKVAAKRHVAYYSKTPGSGVKDQSCYSAVAIDQPALVAPTIVQSTIIAAGSLGSGLAYYLGYTVPSGILAAGTAAYSASVALSKRYRFDSAATPDFSFGVAYGHSRLFTGLDPTTNHFFKNRDKAPISLSSREEHAEQMAILAAHDAGLTFADRNGNNHLYVSLAPCAKCQQWLGGRNEAWNVYWG